MSKITWSFPLIFLVLTSCSANNQSSVSIIKHWQYCYNNNKEITNTITIPETGWIETDKLINPPNRNANEVLWLRVPTDALKESHLQIPRFGMEEYHVYFDTNKVFEQKSFSFSQEGGSFSGLSWQIIPVQRNSTFCYIGVQSSLKDIGFWGKFYNGSKGELITAIIQRDILTLVVASIQIFAGILALLIFILRKKEKIYLSLAIITISVALYSIFFTDIRSFFLFQNGWIAIWIGSIVFTSIGIVLYFSDLFQGLSKRLMEYSAIASFMYYIVIVLLHSFGILHIYNSRIPYYFFLLVNIPVIAYSLFKKTLHKNHEARIIIFAISILILSAIFEMFRAIWAVFPGFVSTTTFSINIFIILLA